MIFFFCHFNQVCWTCTFKEGTNLVRCFEGNKSLFVKVEMRLLVYVDHLEEPHCTFLRHAKLRFKTWLFGMTFTFDWVSLEIQQRTLWFVLKMPHEICQIKSLFQNLFFFVRANSQWLSFRIQLAAAKILICMSLSVHCTFWREVLCVCILMCNKICML